MKKRYVRGLTQRGVIHPDKNTQCWTCAWLIATNSHTTSKVNEIANGTRLWDCALQVKTPMVRREARGTVCHKWSDRHLRINDHNAPAGR